MKQFSDFYSRLRHSPFVVNLATLSTGTIIAQIIPFFATVILSRLYNPDEMGEWGVFSSYASIFAIIGTLRYDGAIVRAKNDTDAYNLTYISIFFSLSFTILVCIIAVVVYFFNVDTALAANVLWLLPIYIFSLLMVQSLSGLATYQRKYKVIATNSINRSTSQSVIRILLGFLHVYRKGMILGAIIGNLFSLFFLYHGVRLLKGISNFSYGKAFILIRDNKSFPKYDLPSNILNSISSHCPPILLAFFFSDSVVGLFSMAYSLLYIPMSFIGSSVSQLYYKDASEAYNNGLFISNLTRRFFVLLSSIGLLFMCILLLCENWIFGVILGEKWNDVGQYAVLLSPWLLLVTSISPLSPVFGVKDKLNVNMNVNIVGVIIRVSSILLTAFLFHSSNLTVFSFGIASSIFYIILGFFILKYGELQLFPKDYILLGSLTVLYLVLYIWKLGIHSSLLI